MMVQVIRHKIMRAGFWSFSTFWLVVFLYGCTTTSGDLTGSSKVKRFGSKREPVLVMLSPELTAPSEPPLSQFFVKEGKARAGKDSNTDGKDFARGSAAARRKAALLADILRSRKSISYDRDKRLVIGLLLPQKRFSSLSKVMEQAARFALTQEQQFSSVRLLVRTSGDKPAFATSAASRLISEGADIIVGPIFADQSRPVAEIAAKARRPMVSFSNNESVSGDFTYRFGLSVREQTASALMDALARPSRAFRDASSSNNASVHSGDWGNRVAFLASQNAYGRTVVAAGSAYLRSRDLLPERVDFIDTALNYNRLDGQIRHIADYDYRQLRLSKQRKGLRLARVDVADGSASAEEIDLALGDLKDLDTYGVLPFDILLLAEARQEALQVVSSYLALYDIDAYSANIYGLSTWGQMRNLWREPQLQGSRYVFPARARLDDFARRFHTSLNDKANEQASVHILTALAYDATLTAARLGAQKGFITREDLEREQGFVGAAGKFRLRPDGEVQRIYEVREITRNGDKSLGNVRKTFFP